ncbi:MAG: glutamine amidotransferase [Desulfobacteraceae bacterium]|jgi:GMP synthase (glutamine-hydrolysing)
MKKLFIIKIGTTFPALAKRLGDFDQWTADALDSVDVELAVVDAEHGAPLPKEEACAGVIITGSHAMVTDNVSWSVKLEKWLALLLEAQIPIFGICYGHQLLARTGGGEVGFHPRGKEIGTVSIESLPACANDPVFQALPKTFLAHVTHLQTVLKLPKAAIRLAANAHEPNHAFRLGQCAWGVQFHPEYNVDIMRSYIEEQPDKLVSAGLDISQLLDSVSQTPISTQLLRKFGNFVADRQAGKGAGRK